MIKCEVFMKKLILGSLLLGTSLFGESLPIGFVNFKVCAEKSLHGKQEKSAFEAMKRQMSETLEKTDREISDLAKKLEDQEFMDGLTPTAQEEMKAKFQTLTQDFARYQNQFYQLMNQANIKVVQTLHQSVSTASEVVRERHHLAVILSEDSTLAVAGSLDLTEEVIAEMDQRLEAQQLASKE